MEKKRLNLLASPEQMVILNDLMGRTHLNMVTVIHFALLEWHKREFPDKYRAPKEYKDERAKRLAQEKLDAKRYHAGDTGRTKRHHNQTSCPWTVVRVPDRNQEGATRLVFMWGNAGYQRRKGWTRDDMDPRDDDMALRWTDMDRFMHTDPNGEDMLEEDWR